MSSESESRAPNLKGEFAPWRLTLDGVSILKLPPDTEARTLLAWLGSFGGRSWEQRKPAPPPRLHEQPLRSYEKPLWPPGQVREVMHPANHPEGHDAVRA